MSHVGPVEDKTASHIFLFLFTIAKILLKLSVCTCGSGTLVIICFLGRGPLFHVKKKGKRKVQGVPQSQTAALPRHQAEEEESFFYCKDLDCTAQMHLLI